jgi:hypothetical protein
MSKRRNTGTEIAVSSGMKPETEISAERDVVETLTLDEMLEARFSGILEWLRENAPEISDEQKHLEGGGPERAYWHYGYAAALQDIKNCLVGKSDHVS